MLEFLSNMTQLQCMVSELKTGFSSAIQHGNTYLREELEENWRSCQKKAVHLEALVESLRVRLPLAEPSNMKSLVNNAQ